MTEEEILRGISQGGRPMEAALRALYQGMAQHMLRFFVHQGATAAEAQDILQDVLIKLVRAADTYRGDGTAKAWIWQIARNGLTDHLRKRTRIAQDEVAVSGSQWQGLQDSVAGMPDSPAGQTAQDCVGQGLEAFAAQMPDRALALTLHMDGLSMAEIGERLGRTAQATKEYLSQCRKRLQPYIAHCTELLQA